MYIKEGTFMPQFTLLPHTADIKIRVEEKTLEHLFIAMLHGMFCCMRPSHEACLSNVQHNDLEDIYTLHHNINVESGDLPTLLVDFLSTALSYADIYDEAYFDAVINSLTDTTIDAILKGVKVEGYDSVEIKAVTYHDLKLERTTKGFVAEVVFDI